MSIQSTNALPSRQSARTWSSSSADLYREVAVYLDPATRTIVVDTLSTAQQAGLTDQFVLTQRNAEPSTIIDEEKLKLADTRTFSDRYSGLG